MYTWYNEYHVFLICTNEKIRRAVEKRALAYHCNQTTVIDEQFAMHTYLFISHNSHRLLIPGFLKRRTCLKIFSFKTFSTFCLITYYILLSLVCVRASLMRVYSVTIK